VLETPSEGCGYLSADSTVARDYTDGRIGLLEMRSQTGLSECGRRHDAEQRLDRMLNRRPIMFVLEGIHDENQL
jgi:hypothetical protein